MHNQELHTVDKGESVVVMRSDVIAMGGRHGIFFSVAVRPSVLQCGPPFVAIIAICLMTIRQTII